MHASFLNQYQFYKRFFALCHNSTCYQNHYNFHYNYFVIFREEVERRQIVTNFYNLLSIYYTQDLIINDIVTDLESGVNYLGNNIVYPSKARAKGIEENIYVQFMVDKKGKIKNVHTVVGQNKILIDAAIKVIEDMPKWVPGEKDGKKINVWYIIPINYKLN